MRATWWTGLERPAARPPRPRPRPRRPHPPPRPRRPPRPRLRLRRRGCRFRRRRRSQNHCRGRWRRNHCLGRWRRHAPQPPRPQLLLSPSSAHPPARRPRPLTPTATAVARSERPNERSTRRPNERSTRHPYERSTRHPYERSSPRSSSAERGAAVPSPPKLRARWASPL